jgi:protein O-mannosyl-transferase
MSKSRRKNNSITVSNLDNQTRYQKFFWIVPVAAFLIFISISGHDFLNYDDDWMIYENKYVTEFGIEQAKALFTDFYRGQYSPVSMAITGLAYQLGNGSTVMLKILGLLFHLISIYLVYLLFSKITANYRLSVLASAVFALHPVQVETVAWLSASLKIGPYAVFTLAGLLAWVIYLQQKKPLFYRLSLVLMVFSCFSKEQAFVFPAYLVLINFLHDKDIFSKKRIAELIPFIITAIIFVVVTYMAVNSNAEVQVTKFSLIEKFLLMAYSFVGYVRFMIIPINLAPAYDSPGLISNIGSLFIYLLMTAGIVFVFALSIKKDKQIAFGIFFFLISIALGFALQIISIRDSLVYDRYLYLGLPGFFLALIVGTERMAKRNLTPVFLVIIAIFSLGTIQRVSVFKNSETLWTDAINKKYKNPLAYNNRGHFYRQNNQIEKALADYNEALKIDPNYYLTLNNRGKIFFDRGQLDQAMVDFNKCLSIAPDFVNALSNRGAAYAAKGNLEGALTDLNKAIAIEPLNTNTLSNLALVNYSLNQFENTVRDVTTYLEVKANDADMINLRSLAFNQLGRDKEALDDLNLALQIIPNQGVFWQNRSFLHNKMGNREAALNDIKKAESLGVKVNQEYLRMLQ